MKGQCKGPMRETKRRGNMLAYTTVMIDSIKVRIEQSGPIGPSRFHYRDTKDHLISRSNFTRKIKKNQVELDYLFVILREFRRKKQEEGTRFFYCIGHAVHVYVMLFGFLV